VTSSKRDPSRYRSRSSSVPDVSGAAYQVFEEDEHGTSRRRILHEDSEPRPAAETGVVPNQVSTLSPASSPRRPAPIAPAIAGLTLVFALVALGFASLSHAPMALMGGLGGTVVVCLVVLVLTRMTRVRPPAA